MGIGYREVLLLLAMIAFMVLIIAGIVWLIGSVSKSARVAPQSASERLSELESLRKANQITAAEYERQRAAIVSSV
jgi:hypothetical protein